MTPMENIPATVPCNSGGGEKGVKPTSVSILFLHKLILSGRDVILLVDFKFMGLRSGFDDGPLVNHQADMTFDHLRVRVLHPQR
mmetsp:Transcript_57269/g.113793  ORF Transcript_57269/g.113793 Transcript_57269/m.113793 type:complete len:84 (-) Transcript_57269:36-287(-)